MIMLCSGYTGPARLQEFSRTGVTVWFDAAEDTFAKTLATEASVAIQTATDCPVQGIKFPT